MATVIIIFFPKSKWRKFRIIRISQLSVKKSALFCVAVILQAAYNCCHLVQSTNNLLLTKR